MWVALGVDLVLLFASGLYLAFRYRPTAGDAKPWLLRASESAHKVSAVAALVLALILVALIVAAAWKRTWGPRVVSGLGGLSLLGALLTGIVSGSRLAWTQLALWAVVTGNNIHGVWLPDSTKFVLHGNTAVDPGTYRQAVWLHVAVIPAVVVIALVMIGLAMHARAPRDGSGTRVTSPVPDLEPVA